MRAPLLIPLVDYQRIYQLIYTVLQADKAHTTRACGFFSTVGTAILRHHYDLPAKVVAGGAAFFVNEKFKAIMYFGRAEDNKFVSDQTAFHAWIECNGFIVDFMAPVFTDLAIEEKYSYPVPRRMFQKPLALDMPSINALSREGDFCLSPNAERTHELMRDFQEGHIQTDLANVCVEFFKRPPKKMRKDMGMVDEKGIQAPLNLRAPAILGVW